MSDGALSQDEIDALLAGSSSFDSGAESPDQSDVGGMGGVSATGAQTEAGLSDADRNAFQATLEKIAESQGSNLSILTGTGVTMSGPVVALKTGAEMTDALPEEMVEVRMDFTEGSPGEHSYLLSVESAGTIAGLMMGQSGDELDDAALSAVSEAISQITGSLTTSLGDDLGISLITSPPALTKVANSQIRFPQSEPFLSG